MTLRPGSARRSALSAVTALLLLAGCSAGQTTEGSTNNGSDGGTPITDGSIVPTEPTPISSLVSESLFNQLFLHRGTSPCPGSFFTYQAFIEATRAFPTFAQQGTLDNRKRELAAFFANISHETTGGWPTAPDGPYSWGLCFIREGGVGDDSQIDPHCTASAQYPCAIGKKYYGRGPLQISYNYNYGPAGQALGVDLLNNPDLVATDPVVSFKTALWFWQTTQAPKPSCHDVMTGQWTPSAQDLAAGRKVGFGLTINIINGGVECNQPTPLQVTDRVGFYNHYCQIFGVEPGPELYCDKMQSY